MTFEELKKASNYFRPAYWLDEFVPRSTRAFVRTALYLVTIISFVLAIRLYGYVPGGDALDGPSRLYLPVFYFSLALTGLLTAFECFYNSMYYGRHQSGMSFTMGRIVRDSELSDITLGFFYSGFGQTVLKRLGIGEEAFAQFIGSRQGRLAPGALRLEAPVSVYAYAMVVFENDKELKDFFFRSGILEKDLVATVSWIERDIDAYVDSREWWSMRNLAKVEGIGKAWSYGQVWLLEKYGGLFGRMHDLTRVDASGSYHKQEVEELEIVLSRASEANALLVGDDGAGKLDVVAKLAKLISQGAAHPAVEHKQVYLLDTNALIAATGEKNAFELELMKLMAQSIKAGNIILVVPDMPGFLASARTLGSDVVSILDPYLSSSLIQFIALCDTMSFHQVIETNPVLVERFEKITVKGGTDEETMRLLEDKVEGFESQNGIYFTYQALGAIAESADRYVVNGVMPDKAVDLLVEAIPAMKAAGKHVVSKQDVMDMVEKKTGIPVAGIKDSEKGKLIDLERILHERIVGQEIAVDAISTAMRRARSGIANPDRPMASFLFIGPTGVGKTETTKALAEVFFGDESKILRFDMSEYSGVDALTRLIGSFEIGKAGTLTTTLRENPYGVLLLDEFEKANREVHNLFLQILDEGVFSDMLGKKVNARNLIIIATSNAGSDIIWSMVQEGKNIVEAKDVVVDTIIKNGIFKPELMNRFDGVILYHPLSEDNLRDVARKMLKGLKRRLEERRINLAITDDLVNFLVRQGSDPKFGARPINRAIQEQVESIIAKKIISGTIPPGGEVALTQSDLEAESAKPGTPSPAAPPAAQGQPAVDGTSPGDKLS